MNCLQSLAKAASAVVFLLMASCSQEQGTVNEGISIGDATFRAPSLNALATAGYLTIKSPTDDVLVSANSPMAGAVEIHTMTMNDGVMSMRPLEKVELDAGKTVVLEPGGMHLMLMELSPQIVDARAIEVILVFEKAGEVPVTLHVARSDSAE